MYLRNVNSMSDVVMVALCYESSSHHNVNTNHVLLLPRGYTRDKHVKVHNFCIHTVSVLLWELYSIRLFYIK